MSEAKVQQLIKGEFNGLCNRSACQQPPATWWNPNTRAYYCGYCALLINRNVPREHPEWRLVQAPSPSAAL